MVKRNEPLPAQVLFLELNAFPLQTLIDETNPALTYTSAIDAGQQSHGTLYDLVSPLSAIMNVRNSGQKAFATRMLELFRARWARESGRSVDIVPVRLYYDFDRKLKANPVNPGPILTASHFPGTSGPVRRRTSRRISRTLAIAMNSRRSKRFSSHDEVPQPSPGPHLSCSSSYPRCRRLDRVGPERF
jgi:hypothetical protein